VTSIESPTRVDPKARVERIWAEAVKGLRRWADVRMNTHNIE